MGVNKLLFFFIALFAFSSYGQTPTVQDCLGAIPICQNQYSQTSAYPGDGNYDSEINENISCLDNEYYSVWYIFTAQTTGYFRFAITPNTMSDDYDWAVFNITNATCADIQTNSSLCVSCNSFGDLFGGNGSTGASSANGGSDNWNGPGDQNGPPWNADIPVTAGSTYAMLICNWSQSTSGYSLNFNGSSATIFDNVPPTLLNVQQSLCGDTSILFQFSEYVMCNSVQYSDFKILDPNGVVIPVVSVVGPACAAGGAQERYFKAYTNYHFQRGDYKLILCGPVNDLCGNTNSSDTILFGINGIDFQTSSTVATCSPNGTATCIAVNGQAPYSYSWTNGGSTSVITGLVPNTYYVRVSDSHGCVDSTFVVVQAGVGNITANLLKHDINCYGTQSGEIEVELTSGLPPYTFQWSNGMGGSNIENLQAGHYAVTITDAYGCSTTDSIEIMERPPFTFILDSVQNEVCSYRNGAIYTHTDGGVSPYRFDWSHNDTLNLAFAESLHGGTYIVSVFDSLNCMQTLNVVVEGQPYPIADFYALPYRSFLDRATINFVNNSQSFSSSFWEFGDNSSSFDLNPSHQYLSLGHFPVMLVVQSENLCFDTLVKYVDIVEDFFFYIPNAFTPNEDGLNDSFGPVFLGVSANDYVFEVYDRWGGIVFVTNDIHTKWNGKTSSGEYFPLGVYHYRIVVMDLCENPHYFMGNFSIIK